MTLRVEKYDAEENEIQRHVDQTSIEGKREIFQCKNDMITAYYKRVKHRNFRVQDLILKKIEVSKHVVKLDPNWEGPYKVVKICKVVSYRLQTMEESDLMRHWNVMNLKKFYA
ncbi:UNVERIFIED_CONTAM: hypothetical protein Slati_1507600 [Sesamum latifolium]|uniref:Reverse transcriptase n=1 Tax=Sesamum latifolium TaxID=2727402 RepID=A0AAW2X644_9LAMI